MSGHYITQQQVKLYMNERNNESLTQAGCAAKAGFSPRSGYTIEQGEHHTQQPKSERNYKTRACSIDKVWIDELKPMLEDNPELQPTTLFMHLQRRYTDKEGEPLYNNKVLRTLQRRVAAWKAKCGPDKPIIFPQVHHPGCQGLSDFTHMDKLQIMIAGEHFKHMLYHFRLVYSKWSYVNIVRGGESFEALSYGLQQALLTLGGSPSEHRTDSLSAAYKNINSGTAEDATKSYEQLCQHYKMVPTRNNKGVSHENGSVESAHGHLKNRINQELLLRGSRDFSDIAEYEQWLQTIVANSNRRNSTNVQREKQALQSLPNTQCIDYARLSIKVSNLSMIVVKHVTYSVASRLAGHTISVHLYQERLELYLGASLISTLTREYRKPGKSRYVIDYHHVIHALIKKPGAFRYCKYREDLLPSNTFKMIWKHIDARFSHSTAPKIFLRLLKLAADHDCEWALGEHVLELIDAKETINIEKIETLFNQSNPILPKEPSPQHSLEGYNGFIPDFINNLTGNICHATT